MVSISLLLPFIQIERGRDKSRFDLRNWRKKEVETEVFLTFVRHSFFDIPENPDFWTTFI